MRVSCIVLVSFSVLTACVRSEESLSATGAGQTDGPFRRPPQGNAASYEATGDMLYAYAEDLAKTSGYRPLASYLDEVLRAGKVRDFEPLLRLVWEAEQSYLPRQVPDFSEVVLDYYKTLGDLAAEAQGFGVQPPTYIDGRENVPLPKLAWTLHGTSRCLDDKWELRDGDPEFIFRNVLDERQQPIRPDAVANYMELAADHKWGQIKTATELLGAIFWQTYRGVGNSGKLFVSNEVAGWLLQLPSGLKHNYQRSLGCGAAFGSQFRAALVSGYTDKNRTFFDPGNPFDGDESSGKFTSLQVRAFGPDVSFIDDRMDTQNLHGLPKDDPRKTWPVDDLATKINYAIMLRPGSTFEINGRRITVGEHSNPRTNISTTSGNSAPQLQNVLLNDVDQTRTRLAKNLSAFVVVGIHYLTSCAESELNRYVHNLADVVRKMKAVNPFLKVHNEYVNPKVPSDVDASFSYGMSDYAFDEFPDLRPQTTVQACLYEGAMFAQLQRAGEPVFDSIDMNVVELWPLLRNIEPYVRGAKIAARLPSNWKTPPQKENLQQTFPLAVWLMKALRLERLSVHATNWDLVLHANTSSSKSCDGDSSDRVSQAKLTRWGLMRSTQTAASKLYNKKGELMSPTDILPFYWYSPPKNVEEVLSFWRFFSQSYATQVNLNEVIRDSYYIHPEYTVLVTPTPWYYVIDGGVTSVGDVRGLTSFYYDIDGWSELQQKLQKTGKR